MNTMDEGCSIPRLDERVSSLKESVDDHGQRMKFVEDGLARSQERQTNAARALEIAQANLDKYKTEANEWRATLSDQRTTLVSNEVYQVQHQSLIDRVVILESSERKGEGRASMGQDIWLKVTVLVGLLISASALGIAYMHHVAPVVVDAAGKVLK